MSQQFESIEPNIPSPTPQSDCSQTPLTGDLHLPQSSFALTAVMKEVNIIKDEVRSLKASVSALHCSYTSDSALRNEIALLRQSLLHTNDSNGPTTPPQFDCPSHLQKHHTCGLNIVSWNCRGLSHAIPYRQLLADHSEILVVSEHWLWPFELANLDHVLPSFCGYGCSDKRLSENSSLSRGCGGVGILWKSSLPVTPVTTMNSDRFVAVQISTGGGSSLSVIGVYLPTTDCLLDVYREYLIELESSISTLQSDGPVLVVGDFNAHLGTLGGTRGTGPSNAQGQLLMDLMCRTNLYATSLSDVATGPQYTFFNKDYHTVVDYCLLDTSAAHILFRNVPQLTTTHSISLTTSPFQFTLI